MPVEEMDAEKAAPVYRAVLRAFLLEVLDPQAWLERIRERLSRSDDSADPLFSRAMAVSQTEDGYEIRTEFRDEEFFAPLEHYVSLAVTVGNPPPTVTEQDPGGRRWNYTMMVAPVLETDREGRPLRLTLQTNAPTGFVELQSVVMSFERTEERISPPGNAIPLPELRE